MRYLKDKTFMAVFVKAICAFALLIKIMFISFQKLRITSRRFKTAKMTANYANQ